MQMQMQSNNALCVECIDRQTGKSMAVEKVLKFG